MDYTSREQLAGTRRLNPRLFEFIGLTMLIGQFCVSWRFDLYSEPAVLMTLTTLATILGAGFLLEAARERYGVVFPPGQFSARIGCAVLAMGVPEIAWRAPTPEKLAGIVLVLCMLGISEYMMKRLASIRAHAIEWESLPDFPCVYLIQGGSLYKIGYTTSITRRVRDLQSGAGQFLSVREIWPADEPKALETALHRRFEDRRIYGEWFDLTPADLAWLERLPNMNGTQAILSPKNSTLSQRSTSAHPTPTPETVTAYFAAGHTTAEAVAYFGVSDSYLRRLKRAGT